MIGQPLGCFLMLGVATISFGIAYALVTWVSGAPPGTADSGWGAFAVTVALSLLIFHPLIDLLHKLEIRIFPKRRGLQVLRIRGFRNHYRVDYVEAGEKGSGRWPRDFKHLGTLQSWDVNVTSSGPAPTVLFGRHAQRPHYGHVAPTLRSL